jgi:hypothetical protein
MRTDILAIVLSLPSFLLAQIDCLPCHKDKAENFALTGMGRSISAPHLSGGHFEHKASGTHFSVHAENGKLIHRAERDGLAAEYPIAFALGSGTVGQSFAVQIAGGWFESPISWYAQRQRWDMSPGYERETAPDFDRPINPECLACHSGRPTGGRLIPSSITCDRCHAMSERHFVNPAKLERARRDSICENCHLQGQARILNPGSKWTDLQPSTTVYVSTEGGPFKVVSHVEQLASSKCARESGDRLWCGTCHSVHGREIDVRKVCLGCHGNRLPTSHTERHEECVPCHMPKRATHDVAHAAYTDHRIASRPGVIRDEAGASGSAKLRAWRDPDPQFRQRNLGLAYIYAGQRELSAEWIQQGFALLASVKSGDPEVEEALGSVLLQKQRPGEAAALFRKTLRADATNPDYLHNLGVAMVAAKDLNGGAAHLEHAVRTNPRFTPSWLLVYPD